MNVLYVGQSRPVLGRIVAASPPTAIAAWLSARTSNRAPAPLIGIGVALVLAQIIGIREKEVGALPAGLPPFAGVQIIVPAPLSVLPSRYSRRHVE
jgi:hypothetical protein